MNLSLEFYNDRVRFTFWKLQVYEVAHIWVVAVKYFKDVTFYLTRNMLLHIL